MSASTGSKVIPARVSDPIQWKLPWAVRGACRAPHHHPNDWFPKSTARKNTKAVRKICDEICPVKTECLNAALRSPLTVGIWGGTGETERRAIIKKGKRSA